MHKCPGRCFKFCMTLRHYAARAPANAFDILIGSLALYYLFVRKAFITRKHTYVYICRVKTWYLGHSNHSKNNDKKTLYETTHTTQKKLKTVGTQCNYGDVKGIRCTANISEKEGK